MQDAVVLSAEPSRPRLLSSWCAVGCHSACLVWKYKQNEQITTFAVSYRRLGNREPLDRRLYEQQTSPNGDLTCIKTKRFTGGRAYITLRDLTPDTWYLVKTTAVNNCGHSKTCTTVIQSSSSPGTLITGPAMLPAHKASTILDKVKPALLLLFVGLLIWVAVQYVSRLWYECVCAYLVLKSIPFDVDDGHYPDDSQEAGFEMFGWIVK